MNEFERLTVSADFLLVAISQECLAKHNGADARGFDFDAFDAIRRDSTFDQSMFAKSFQLLRRLLRKQALFTLSLTQIGEVPRRRSRYVR